VWGRSRLRLQGGGSRTVNLYFVGESSESENEMQLWFYFVKGKRKI
jgi:hypothetical protein